MTRQIKINTIIQISTTDAIIDKFLPLLGSLYPNSEYEIIKTDYDCATLVRQFTIKGTIQKRCKVSTTSDFERARFVEDEIKFYANKFQQRFELTDDEFKLESIIAE